MPNSLYQNDLHATVIEMISKQDEYEKQKAWYANYLHRYLEKKRKRWGIFGRWIYTQKKYEALLKKFDEMK